MKIRLIKGYLIRCIYTINIIIIPIPLFSIISLCLGEIITGVSLLVIYLIIFFVTVIIISLLLVRKKYSYKYLFLTDDSLSLITKNHTFLSLEDVIIYVDNPILGLLLSPYYLITTYEIKSDFDIDEENVGCVKVYLSIMDYFKLKSRKYRYINF